MVKVQPVIKKHAQKSLVLVMKYLSLHSSLDYILIKRKNLLLIKSKPIVLDGELINGNIESRSGRKQYSRIKEYMFMALVAKTEVDWIAFIKEKYTSRR